MASFLSLYKEEYGEIEVEDQDYISSFPAFNGKIEAWKKDIKGFNNWVEFTKTKPAALAIPATNTKISLIYCLHMDDIEDRVIGIKGFAPFSRTIINPTDLFVDLVSSGVAQKIRECKLPTTDQLFAIDTASKLIDIPGESGQTIEQFGSSYSAAIPWPGLLLPDAVEGKPAIAASDMLWEILENLRALRDHPDPGDQAEDLAQWQEIVDTWKDHLCYLWVIAKGGAMPVATKQNFDRKSAKGFEEYFLGKWQQALGTNESTKEKAARNPDNVQVETVTEEDIARASQAAISEGMESSGPTIQQSEPQTIILDQEEEDLEADEVIVQPTTTETGRSERTEAGMTSNRDFFNRRSVGAQSAADSQQAVRFARGEPSTSTFSRVGSRDRDYDDGTESNQAFFSRHLSLLQQEATAPPTEPAGRTSVQTPSEQATVITTTASRAQEPTATTSGQRDDDDDSGEDDDPEIARFRQIKRKRLLDLRTSEAARNRVMAEMAVENHFFQQRKQILDEHRKSATSHWTESHRRLVGMLSMPDDGTYPRREPKWTKFATTLFKDKAMTNAQNLMAQSTKRSWPGSMLRSGIVTLVSQGFAAPEQRREKMGFSVFHFAPIGHDEDMTQKEKEQVIRSSHGDGELSEELVKEYARKKYFVPFRIDEAINMLTVCIKVLELICGKNSLATLPYRHGKDILTSYTYEVHQALYADKIYLVKFLYFIDGVFQNVVKSLLRCLEFGSPTVQAAARKIHLIPRQDIEDVLRNFLNNGIPVSLPSPSGLISKSNSQNGGGKIVTTGSGTPKASGSDGKKPGLTTPDPKKQKGKEIGGVKSEPWHRENPSPVAAWEFPVDTQTRVFFPTEGGFNSKFPRFCHHVTNKNVPMCLKYQTAGECFRGSECRLAHVPADKMSKAKRDIVDKVMAEQKRIAIENKLME